MPNIPVYLTNEEYVVYISLSSEVQESLKKKFKDEIKNEKK